MSKKKVTNSGRECVQEDTIKFAQIDIAVLKTNNATMALDIKEMKSDIKSIAVKIDTYTTSIKRELDTKASRQELHEKFQALNDEINLRQSNSFKIVDIVLKVMPWVATGIFFWMLR